MSNDIHEIARDALHANNFPLTDVSMTTSKLSTTGELRVCLAHSEICVNFPR
jgi:hypothetical protein